jgi:predicted nucleotidyltransferase
MNAVSKRLASLLNSLKKSGRYYVRKIISPSKPKVIYSHDLEGIAQQSLAYWQGLAQSELTPAMNIREWSALMKTYRMYCHYGFDEPNAWGRAIEDMADKYPDGLPEGNDAQGENCPLYQRKIKTPHLPSLYRHEAEAIVAELPRRIELLNESSNMMLQISEAVILGSYLKKNRMRPMDIDIAIEFWPRDAKNIEAWTRVKEGIEKNSMVQREQPGSLRGPLSEQEKYWLNAKNECLSFLKDFCLHLDIADMSWVEDCKIEHQIMYPEKH